MSPYNALIKEYELFCRVYFDKLLTEEQRVETKKAILDILKHYESPRKQVRVISKADPFYVALREKGKRYSQAHAHISASVGFDVWTGHANEETVAKLNEILNKFWGLATTLPNRKIRSVLLRAGVTAKVAKLPNFAFLKASDVAELSSRLKLKLEPAGAVFRSRVEEKSLLVVLSYSIKADRIVITMRGRASEEEVWDAAMTKYKLLEIYLNSLNIPDL